MTQTDGDAAAAGDGDDKRDANVDNDDDADDDNDDNPAYDHSASRPSWALRISTSHGPRVFMKHLI